MSGNVQKYTKHKGYESLSRDMLQDIDNLSLQAIGLLANMVSMPDDWVIHKTELYKRFAKNGRTSVQSTWNELVENKYIVQFRKRNGKKWDYYYFFSQTNFSDEDVKILEKEVGLPVWNGKKYSDVENQHPNKRLETGASSNVDFGLPNLDFPKSTYIKLITNEIDYKDLDTKDTKDTVPENIQKNNMQRITELERIKRKEEYMNQAFYGNEELIPKRIADMLSAFSRTPDEATKFYNIILTAKKKVEKESNEMIWLEHEPELTEIIINSFSRAIRNIEKGNEDIENPKGYLYCSIHDPLAREISARGRRVRSQEHGY